AQAEVGGDLDLLALHVGRQGGGVDVGSVDAAFGHEDVAVPHADLVGLEGDAGAAQLAGHPTPVRVLAVPGALHQDALRHLAGASPRLVVGQGAVDVHRHDLGVALSVTHHL